MAKSALITGITGQDGSYLAELLLDKGYVVHGMVRRSSTSTTSRIDHLLADERLSSRLLLHFGDLTDGQSVTRMVLETEPDEIYNLGCQSHVWVSFEQPVYTVQTAGIGALTILESARLLQQHKPVRVYQAGSSEMFGDATETPQTERTPFRPQSPYACAKVYAFQQAQNYRQGYDLFAANGILFNHESERRGESFVTRKITLGAARIKLGLQQELALGNLDAQRDWGYAKDYVEGMWRMLQHDRPDDFVMATGETRSVREFCDLVFARLDLDPAEFVRIDPRHFRPAEVRRLQGDASKAERELGWKPSTTFEQMVRIMTDHDLALARREAETGRRGFLSSSSGAIDGEEGRR